MNFNEKDNFKIGDVFLVENVQKRDKQTTSIKTTIDLDLNTPIKEMIWVLKDTNNKTNFNLQTFILIINTLQFY